MTLEEKAIEYAEKHSFRVPYDGSNKFYDDVDFKASKEGYIAGAKENGIQWHNLKENPNDLPERDKTFVTDVSVTVIVYPLGFAMYYFFDKKWYSNGKEVKVDRWCEIPQFKG